MKRAGGIQRWWIVTVLTGILTILGTWPAEAQYDPRWEWYTISNEHFIIYYPKGHEQLAQRVLALSDEVHRDITGYLGVEPRPCPIVLDPGTDIFNGFMDVFPNRISLYETPLYTVRGFGPASDLMDLVFTHEYTHYVHITMRRGWYGDLTTVLGDGLAISNIISPGWIDEGITTNTETLFTDGGRGRCPLFKGEMRSFTEGEGLWNLSAAGTTSPYAPPGSRIYLGGYHMVDYLNRTYGQDAIARLGRYQAEHPVGGTREALEKVTGKSPRQFYRDFLADFGTQAEQLKQQALAEGLPVGRVVLTAPRDGFDYHFWTERGTIVGLRRGYNERNALVEIDPATGREISHIDTGNMFNIAARRMADNRLLLSEVYVHPLGYGGLNTTDLVLFDPRTRERQRLTTGQHIFGADRSPDGKTIVATRRNGMWIDLVLLDADGSNLRTLVSRPGIYFDAPCWSPDGSRIAAVIKSGRNADIVLVDPDNGSMQLPFASDVYEDNEPSFSPDGRWLVFSSDRSGIWNIFAWNLTNSRLYQLTSVPYVAGNPHISPDGQTLSFSSMVRGMQQVCTLPFQPEAGKTIAVAEASEIALPDLQRLQPEVTLDGRKGIPPQAYKPFVHAPYVSSDEDGTQAGVYITGADPVGKNAYTAQILYGFKSERIGYDLNLTNRSFWPALSARVYDTALEGNTIGGGSDHWFRERGAELAAGLDVIHRIVPDTIVGTYRVGPRLRYFSSLSDEVQVTDDENQSVGFFGEMTLSRTPDTAQRDMVPHWGQTLALSHEEGFSGLGGELPGHNSIISFTQYVPSLLKHQGLALRATYQGQEGLLYYDKVESIPRGYHDDDTEGDLDKRKNLCLSAEYHFPILFTDNGIGLVLYHSNLLKGSFFVDYGAGWDGGFDWGDWTDKARTSIGATLTDRCVLLGILPLEYGLQAGYKTHEHDGFVNFLFKINL